MGVLQGKAVLITGAGRGIGAACARHAAAEGAALIVNDVDAQAAAAVAKEIVEAGGRAVAHAASVAVWGDAEALVARCVKEFGAIDGLVNNAGLYELADLAEIDETHVRRMVEVNMIGTAFCATHAARAMRERGGSIVNLTSGAQTGLRGGGIYGATKGGVASATYAWALDCEGSALRVNAVSPVADTRMSSATDAFRTKKGLPPLRSGPRPGPEVNAPVVSFLLSDLSRGVNGQVLWILGRRLSLMTHPAVLAPVLERDDWNVEAIAAAFRTELGRRQQRLGVVGTRAEPVDLSKAISRP
jgi:NAD(P)-dependent dehydrogenase (short-subunit alcohol dehydrogenase family)